MKYSVLSLLLVACTGEKPSINPGGGDPEFSLEYATEEYAYAYLPAELVHQEYTSGKSFYLLDARPTNDYNLSHINGAISTPFYEIEELGLLDGFDQGPWYVAYCGCPHSESGIVAQALVDMGHVNVGIIDEGFLVWEERGYPTTGNSE